MTKSLLNKKFPGLNSFFDDAKDRQPTFWCKDQPIKNLKDWTPTTGHFFIKKSRKRIGEQKRGYVCLLKNYLIKSETKEWYRKYKYIDLSKHFVTLKQLPKQHGNLNTGFSLTYNRKQIELFTNDSDDMNRFFFYLKRYVVQTRFEDEYKLEEKLGAGSYATVYKVQSKIAHTTYAAKVLDLMESPLRNPELTREAIKNEANIQRQLDHDNLVRLHELYESETQIIIVMEYVSGRRLLDYVIQHSPLSEKECILLIKGLVEAVIHLHSLGFIHRDIKLENIVITGDEKTGKDKLSLKLLDFGLACNANNIEFLKKSGTPGYVAPEVLLNEDYGNKVDVFSLGVVLFTMLCGQSPFKGPDRNAVLAMNQKCEYNLKSRNWTKVSQNAKDLVKRMLEADKNKRIDAETTLKHPWFTLVYLNGVQPLINIPQFMTMSNKHVFVSGCTSPHTPTTNPGTVRTNTPFLSARNGKALPFDPHNLETKLESERRKSTTDTYRSLSVRNYDIKRKSHNLNPNQLLQIPLTQATNTSPAASLVVSEREKTDVSPLNEAINKTSIKTFYKLASSGNYDSNGTLSGSAKLVRKSVAKSTTLDEEIAKENPHIKEKASTYRALENSPRSSAASEWSHNGATLSGIPEDKEEKQSSEITFESDFEVLVQRPRVEMMLKVFSPHLKSRRIQAN